jgi:hypothetical protein
MSHDEAPSDDFDEDFISTNEPSFDDFDEDFMSTNEPSFDDFDAEINVIDSMDTAIIEPHLPASNQAPQRQEDIRPTSLDSSHESSLGEQRENYSQFPDTQVDNESVKQLKRTSYNPQNDNKHAHRVQRHSQEQPQASEQSNETQEADSSEYQAEDDTSDSFQSPVTANNSLPIQRKANVTNPEPQADDEAIDKFSRLADDSTPSEQSGLQQQHKESFMDWNESAYDDDTSDQDKHTIDRAAPQPPIQRFTHDSEWDADEDLRADDYNLGDQEPVRARTDTHTPIQRHSDDSEWEVDNHDYDIADKNRPEQSSSTQKAAIQHRADESNTPDYGDQTMDFADDLPADQAPESNDFPIVQRSMGADGKIYYNVVEPDDEPLQDYDEQDTDIYHAMLEAGIIDPNIPHPSYYESSEQRDDFSAESTSQNHPQSSIQRQSDDGHIGAEYQQGHDDINSDDNPTIQRSMGVDGKIYYNLAENDDSLSPPEQSMDVYQALLEAGMISAENAQTVNTNSADAMQRTSDSPLSSIGVPQDIQDAMLQRLREKNSQLEQNDTTQDKTHTEDSHPSPQTPIQRTYTTNVQRKPPIPDTIMREDEAGKDEGSEEDIDKLARDVYKILHRRLRDEAERRNRK